jgi:serine/threonine-protein kinase HipA
MPAARTMISYALNVFAGADLVGTLQFDPQEDVYAFTYDARWTRSPRAFPLSPHLPLKGPAAASGAVRRFVENLLPEGTALDVASKFSNITKNNIFGLIRHLGRETAGALSFLPEGQAPQPQEAVRRPVPFAELEERIQDRAQRPFTVWDGKVRMSVAGFQDKLLVFVDGETLFLADGSLASTHILKPEPLGTAMPCMVANEHFCMQLTNRISEARFGLAHAAHVQILRVPSPVLLVQRFDRKRVQAGVERVHIVDGCQVLDMPVSAKYERNIGSGKDVQHIRDGVSFEKLMAVRSMLEEPALGMQRLVMWAFTTLLFGNSDAHGKNISFYCRGAGLAVAELYDLVSVVQYDSIHHDLAMAFGDEFSLDSVRSFALADFCERSGIARAYFARELKRLCVIAIEQALLQAADPAYQNAERAFVRGLEEFVVTRAHALRAMADDVPRFGKDNF